MKNLYYPSDIVLKNHGRTDFPTVYNQTVDIFQKLRVVKDIVAVIGHNNFFIGFYQISIVLDDLNCNLLHFVPFITRQR